MLSQVTRPGYLKVWLITPDLREATKFLLGGEKKHIDDTNAHANDTLDKDNICKCTLTTLSIMRIDKLSPLFII